MSPPVVGFVLIEIAGCLCSIRDTHSCRSFHGLPCIQSCHWLLYSVLSLVVLYSFYLSSPVILFSVSSVCIVSHTVTGCSVFFSSLYPMLSLVVQYSSRHCIPYCHWLFCILLAIAGCPVFCLLIRWSLPCLVLDWSVSRLVIGWSVPCLVICRFVPCLVVGCLYPVLSLVDLYPVLLLPDQCLVLPSWLHDLYRKPEC